MNGSWTKTQTAQTVYNKSTITALPDVKPDNLHFTTPTFRVVESATVPDKVSEFMPVY